MKTVKTAMIAGISAVAIGGAGIGVASVSAMNGYGSVNSSWKTMIGSEEDDKFDAEVSAAIAAKYELNEDEVKQVVEDVRDDQFNLLDDDRRERLEQAVEDEKLTQDEHDYIVKKLEKVDGMIDQLDDTDGRERRELASDIKSELKDLIDWMEKEDVSVRLIAGATLGLEHNHSRR